MTTTSDRRDAHGCVVPAPQKLATTPAWGPDRGSTTNTPSPDSTVGKVSVEFRPALQRTRRRWARRRRSIGAHHTRSGSRASPAPGSPWRASCSMVERPMPWPSRLPPGGRPAATGRCVRLVRGPRSPRPVDPPTAHPPHRAPTSPPVARTLSGRVMATRGVRRSAPGWSGGAGIPRRRSRRGRSARRERCATARGDGWRRFAHLQ